MQVLFEIMVQTKQKRGIGFQNPSPRSFSGGVACVNNQHIGLLVRSALLEELNSMAAGGGVKETVMTIPFLQTFIINIIAGLEKRFTSDCDKRRALAQPETPWKWFTSYEIGFHMVSDEHDRPLHPFVSGENKRTIGRPKVH